MTSLHSPDRIHRRMSLGRAPPRRNLRMPRVSSGRLPRPRDEYLRSIRAPLRCSGCDLLAALPKIVDARANGAEHVVQIVGPRPAPTRPERFEPLTLEQLIFNRIERRKQQHNVRTDLDFVTKGQQMAGDGQAIGPACPFLLPRSSSRYAPMSLLVMRAWLRDTSGSLQRDCGVPRRAR